MKKPANSDFLPAHFASLADVRKEDDRVQELDPEKLFEAMGLECVYQRGEQ